MSTLQLLDRAASATACEILKYGGSGLIGSAVFSAASLTPVGIGARLTLGAASLLAANYGCSEQDVDEGFDPSRPGDCQKVNGTGKLQAYNVYSGWYDETGAQNWSTVIEITGYDTFEPAYEGAVNRRIRYRTTEGDSSYLYRDPNPEGNPFNWRINPNEGSSCVVDGGNPKPPKLPSEPIKYVDQSTNCTYNVTALGFADRSPSGGNPGMVFLIESATETRASGGRIGGCNFAPTIYYGGGGGDGNGPYYVPAPDGRDDGDDGVPWWLPPLIAGTASAIVNEILDALTNGEELKWDDKVYQLQGVCETETDEGKQPLRTTPVAGGVFAKTVVSRLDALEDLFQFHLGFKTPTCGSEKPKLEGTWISTRWESDSNSPNSDRPLRKLFRYRSKSTRNEDQLREYWASLTWKAGGICVRHTGAWWGNPQVWAASEEEGKRVIRFAGAEAGIDPDKAGEWATGSSRSPRYGMSGTMRLEEANGLRWVTRRDGPDGPWT